NIEFTAVWSEVSPRSDAPDLLIEEDGRLLFQRSDFSPLYDFGAVGPVDCPIAYDAKTQTAYRYVSASSVSRRDYSQLRSFNLVNRTTDVLLDLPLNQWTLWLLEWIDGSSEEAGQLFGLLATDRMAADRIVIDHQLFALKPEESRARLRPICRDAYRPLAFSRHLRELIFSGADGIYLVDLKGTRRATFPGEDSTGQGAAFDPSGASRVIIGGDGLFLWDLKVNQSERLSRLGRYPVWATNQDGFWYSESSSDVHYYDLSTRESTKLLGAANIRNPELWHARPVTQTRCGRYIAVSITAKRLQGVSRKANATGSRERVFVHDHELIICDLERQEYWRRTGFANHVRWAE
ncbi:MAG: hypothetical protein ABF323_00645, partial [Lentimonas sp.]